MPQKESATPTRDPFKFAFGIFNGPIDVLLGLQMLPKWIVPDDGRDKRIRCPFECATYSSKQMLVNYLGVVKEMTGVS